jgi:excisionase family DNA binding protein
MLNRLVLTSTYDLLRPSNAIMLCWSLLSMPKLLTPRAAAQVLGVSYASVKQWIYHGKLKSVQTPGRPPSDFQV